MFLLNLSFSLPSSIHVHVCLSICLCLNIHVPVCTCVCVCVCVGPMCGSCILAVRPEPPPPPPPLQGSHHHGKTWKTWKMDKMNSMLEKIMEFDILKKNLEKSWNFKNLDHGKSWNFEKSNIRACVASKQHFLCKFVYDWKIKVGKMPANKHICHASGIYREIPGNNGKYWQISGFQLD